jgi:fructokinase
MGYKRMEKVGENMSDVIALGELLIDFTPNGINELGNPIYVANPGGAPGNVMVALSCLGKDTAFIGSVGHDKFGEMLKETLEKKGVNTQEIVYADIPTTLAFVHIADDGDRSFSFYRNPGADMMLSAADIKKDMIASARIFHVGSISMTDNPVRDATLTALRVAKENGVTVSFDPNLRPLLWKDLDDAREAMLEVLAFADIVKVSDEELQFITGEEDLETAANLLVMEHHLQVLFVTLGGKGSYCFSAGASERLPSYSVYAIDTTGCGDAFFAGTLYQILEMGLLGKNLKPEEMRKVLRFGNAMGGYVATQKGAIPAMPTLQEIETFMLNKTSSR